MGVAVSNRTGSVLQPDDEAQQPKARILLVEDDPSVHIVLLEQLRIAGFDVTATVDVGTFLAAFVEPGMMYDLAIVDLRLPGLNGDKAISWITESEDETRRELPGGRASLQVKQWQGSSWRTLATDLRVNQSVSNQVRSIQMAFPTSGQYRQQPHVAWVENVSLYVKRYNGTSWELVGGGPVANPVSFRDAFVAQGDRLYVAYVTQGVGSALRVKEWNGSTWEFLGGDLRSTKATENFGWPRLAAARSGRVYSAYGEKLSGVSFFDGLAVKYWDGKDWGSTGPKLSHYGSPAWVDTAGHALAVGGADGLTPWVAWLEYDPARFNPFNPYRNIFAQGFE